MQTLIGPVLLESSDLTIGTNALASNSGIQFGSSAALRATGALSATGSISWATSATLFSEGNLDAIGAISYGTTAALTATGTLNATGSLTWGSSAGLAEAVGDIFATGALVFTSSADLDYTFTPPTQDMAANGSFAFTVSSALLADANTGVLPRIDKPGIVSRSTVRRILITH